MKNLKKLSREAMRNVFAGTDLTVEGSCKKACDSCSANSECCSTVCATDQPGCGGGRRCLK